LAVSEGLTADLEETLQRLRRIPGIEAAALVGKDGVVSVHNLPPDADSREVGAIAAALTGTATQAAEALRKGRFLQCIVVTDEGRLVTVEAGPDHFLVTLLKEDANLGLVLMGLDRAAKEAETLLETKASGDAPPPSQEPPAPGPA
jgi:predicted regulator of Ras-like GTPase activity (Roadblock/LC7/MglB family)